MMIKKYNPQSLVAISRYQRYFPSLDKDIRLEIYERMAELIKEEKEYCDKGN